MFGKPEHMVHNNVPVMINNKEVSMSQRTPHYFQQLTMELPANELKEDFCILGF